MQMVPVIVIKIGMNALLVQYEVSRAGGGTEVCIGRIGAVHDVADIIARKTGTRIVQ